MRIPLYQVDAFTTTLFAGNPAAVMPMDRYPTDAVLQALAAENNLAETAFLVPEGDDFRLRWFTPTVEVPLCGHATLASAAVVIERLDTARTTVVFHTASGPLTVRRAGDGYVMDFPAQPALPVPTPTRLVDALGAPPIETLADAINYVAVFADERAVRALAPDMAALMQVDRSGVIATARSGDGYDFVSRYFAPRRGIPEDPVTGSAHCTLVPYWAERLGRTSLRAFQASSRGGDLRCSLAGDRVEIEGRCVFYLEGTVTI